MNCLDKVMIEGYKSIRSQELEFRRMNIFIGGNGAGKSNLISFFEMLGRIKNQELSGFVIEQGGANVMLYNGKKITSECSFAIYRDQVKFSAILKPGAQDSLYFARQEMIDSMKNQIYRTTEGMSEFGVYESLKNNKVLDDIGIYHFHDTGKTSKMKSMCNIHDNIKIASDGGNIAAILYRIKLTDEEAYRRIVQTVRLVVPYFQDFVLRENPINPQLIRLEWKKIGCEMPFGSEQLSDGTLRFICLVTLLCQPEDMRDDVIIVDEPELGLHPIAITIIAELMKKYGVKRQVITATQSVEFMNEFSVEDVIIVDCPEGETLFKRLEATALNDWLEEYSIGELWQKNVLGGRP